MRRQRTKLKTLHDCRHLESRYRPSHLNHRSKELGRLESTMAYASNPLFSAAILISALDIGVNALVSPTGVITTPSPSLSTPAASYSPTSSSSSGDDEDNGECRLLGPFSLVVQAALGMLALLSLVYKRWRERPQRPVKVWAFDASKQVFGSSMLHLFNLLMSMFSAGQFEITSKYKPNPCSFYLLNLGIDVSFFHPPILIFQRATADIWPSDHPRYPYLDLYTPFPEPLGEIYPPRKSSGIDRIWEL